MTGTYLRADPRAVEKAVAELDAGGVVVKASAVALPDPGGRLMRDHLRLHIEASGLSVPATVIAVAKVFRQHCPNNPVHIQSSFRDR